MSMPWIKLYSEILDDPKIGRLPDATKWRFVQILLVAGECDAEGYLVNGEEMLGISDLAWRLRVDENVLREDFDILEKAGLIADDGGAWLVVNFSKRQGRSQSEKREMWRERKQRQRERDRAEDEEPITGDDEIPQESVTGDSQENHAPRVEKSREEKEEEKKNGADAPNSLSSGLRHFLDAFGRKRFATKIQIHSHINQFTHKIHQFGKTHAVVANKPLHPKPFSLPDCIIRIHVHLKIFLQLCFLPEALFYIFSYYVSVLIIQFRPHYFLPK